MLDLDNVLEYSRNIELNLLVLLPILIALEAVLSADNAIALASITCGLEDPKLQNKALNIGLFLAFILRILLIITATWVIKYWQFELLGALYLLWLVFRYFFNKSQEDKSESAIRYKSFWQVLPLIAVTDLAFSLDSVTAAIAISDQAWLVITGATIGIIILRFMASLFIQWLKDYVYLETAGYLTVGLVGLRLLLRVIDQALVPPEWLMVVLTLSLFAWGFSQRVEDAHNNS
jgi:YkoY family integral membrane protein